MNKITTIDNDFKRIIDNFYSILPCLDSKDIVVKNVRNLVNEAVKTYAIEQCFFIDTANMLLDTLNTSYELSCSTNNAIAQKALLEQSKMLRNPLKKTLKPLVKIWQCAEVKDER